MTTKWWVDADPWKECINKRRCK